MALALVFSEIRSPSIFRILQCYLGQPTFSLDVLQRISRPIVYVLLAQVRITVSFLLFQATQLV